MGDSIDRKYKDAVALSAVATRDPPLPTEPLAPLNKEFEAASHAALSMARTHLARAALLGKNRDYAGGYSFLVLALEEASKFVFLKGAAIGVVTFDRAEASDHIYIPAHFLTKHPVKHSVFAAGFFARMLMEAALGLSEANRTNSEALTSAAMLEMLRRAMEEAVEALPAVGEYDPKKQAAFYSGDQTPAGDRMQPAAREDYRRLRRVVLDQVEFLEIFQSFQIPAKVLEETRGAVRQLRSERGPASKAGDLEAFDYSRS